jgi:hypothetical protein
MMAPRYGRKIIKRTHKNFAISFIGLFLRLNRAMSGRKRMNRNRMMRIPIGIAVNMVSISMSFLFYDLPTLILTRLGNKHHLQTGVVQVGSRIWLGYFSFPVRIHLFDLIRMTSNRITNGFAPIGLFIM